MIAKQYLKMADAFAHDSVEALEQHIHAGYMSKHACEYAAHAINSHDELVAENERLNKALDDAIAQIQDVNDELLVWMSRVDDEVR